VSYLKYAKVRCAGPLSTIWRHDEVTDMVRNKGHADEDYEE
jgi:hypothetical protein